MTHIHRSLAAVVAVFALTMGSSMAQNHAKLINADDLWGSPWNLKGSGITVGFFEYGYPNTSHTEFQTNRVSVVNQPPNKASDAHTTGTVGVCVARGARVEARGIVYRAKAEAYYIPEDGSQAEVLRYYFDQGTFSATNHSYSSRFGWLRNRSTLRWEFIGAVPTNDHPDPFGAYLDESRLFDSIVHASNYVVPVVTAGNNRGIGPSPGDTVNYYPLNANPYERVYVTDGSQPPKNGGAKGYDCLPPTAVAKNVITVGSVDITKKLADNSQIGPTNDGRIKPDVVALGVDVSVAGSRLNPAGYDTKSGTSFAAPAVTGVVVQLQELYRRFFGVEMLPSTAKALLIHTASDLGTKGPDFKHGWGLVDAKAAARLLQTSATDGRFAVAEHLMEQGRTQYFEMKATDPSVPLKVTIAWTDPPAVVTEGGPKAAAYSTDPDPKLVNDLDLRVEKYVNGVRTATLRPFVLSTAFPANAAGHARNNKDNVEQVLIEDPDPAAIYRVIVSHTGSLQNGEQDYTRTVSGGVVYLAPPTPVTATQQGMVEKSDGTTQAFSAQLAWKRIPEAETYQIRYRRYGVNTWTTRTSATNSAVIVGLELGTYYFQVRARRGNRYSTYATTTKTFQVTPQIPSQLLSGPVGPTSAVVKWQGDANASEYRVMYVRVDRNGQLLDNGWSVRYAPNTSVSLLNLVQDTRYAWTVQAIYTNGIKSDFAGSQAFVTRTTCEAYEPNNAIDLAAPIETDRNVYARACKDDVADWYSVTVTNSRPHVKIYLYAQPVPLQLQLYRRVNGSAQKISDSPDNGNNTSTKVLTANNLTPGTYYVRIFNPDAASVYSSFQEYPLRVNTRSTPF